MQTNEYIEEQSLLDQFYGLETLIHETGMLLFAVNHLISTGMLNWVYLTYFTI